MRNLPSEAPAGKAAGPNRHARVDLRPEAVRALALGISVHPPTEDGKKKPFGNPERQGHSWKEYQSRLPTPDEIGAWYGLNGRPKLTGIGFICGRVSARNQGENLSLNVLDFDDRAAYDRFKELATLAGRADLVEHVEKGCLDTTPKGGMHLHAYVETAAGKTWPCERLAQRPEPNAKNGQKVLVETKCEGGFIIAAPSCGSVHPTGKPYVRLRGGLSTIATITAAEWTDLCDLVRALDEMPIKEPAAEQKVRTETGNGWDDGGTIGVIEDFNARNKVSDLLPPGWKHVFTHGDTEYWRRPGKDHGISATVGRGGSNRLYVFSSSTEFEPQKPYSAFAVYAHLNHGGDFRAASMKLLNDGYGTHKRWVEQATGEWDLQVFQNPCPKGHRIAVPGDPPPRSKVGRKGSRGNNGPPPGDGQAAGPEPARPEIEVNHERHRVLAETLAVLPSDPALFRRGDLLVRIEHEADDEIRLAGGVKLRNASGMARVIPVSEAGLSCRLTALAEFFTWSVDRHGEATARPAHPPAWLLSALLEHSVYPGLRKLRGVASAPFPRPDGSLVTTPGYDPDTGVYLDAGVIVAPVPKSPTKEDARAAASRILDLVEQFPFASDDDKAVWLAGLLTAITRPGIRGPVPGVAIVSNMAGTGKGKLVDLIGVIATGNPVPTTSYPGSDDEARKVKAALALAATSVVHLDNLDAGRLYGSGPLDSALTSMEVNERILGQTKTTGAIELRPAWFLTGNNISPGKDAYRRWLVCNLSTTLEDPEERDDLKIADLIGHASKRRSELLHDALVVLRAHAAAGRPTNGWGPLGSFEEWDRVVRGAVWFATERDCNVTRQNAAKEAPEREANMALVEAWSELLDGGETGNGITAADACKMASPNKDGGVQQPNLADALAMFSRDGRVPSPRSLGNLIRAISSRNIGGKRFVKAGADHKTTRWRVEPVS